MSTAWLLLDSGPGEAALNMALDEALLVSAPELRQPVLRFYGWRQPAATFGYFQKYADVERTTRLRPLIRRPTGGGLVPHDADWTYSVAIPPGHEWYDIKAEESYRRMHEWIQSAFRRLGVATSLAEDSRRPRPGECFAGHEFSDVLWEGRKVAGAAQRRTRTGLLIEGSVQPPPLRVHRSAWQQAMIAYLKTAGLEWTPLPWLAQQAEALAREKYSRDSYNRRR